MSKAIVIKTDGTIRIIDAPDDPGWMWMRDNIGCEWIEFVRPRRLPAGFVMVVDEEGLLKENKFNCHGSYLYEYEKHGQPIVGDVMILKEVETDDGMNCVGLTEKEAEQIVARLTEEVVIVRRQQHAD